MESACEGSGCKDLMCAMLLADLGATVLRIERKESVDLGLRRPVRYDLVLRNRMAIMRARGVFVEVDGVVQPGPAPRFSRTPPRTPVPFAPSSQAMVDAALENWLPVDRISELRSLRSVVK